MPVPQLPPLKRQRIFHVEYFMRRLQKEYPCMLLRVNIPDLNLCIRVRVRERECAYTSTYSCVHSRNSLCFGESFRRYCCQFTPGHAKGLKADIVRHHMTFRLTFFQFKWATIMLEVVNRLTLRKFTRKSVIWNLISHSP